MTTPDKIKRKKAWMIPEPKSNEKTSDIKYKEITQEKFYCEYFPQGHAIHDESWFGNIKIVSNDKKVHTHLVNRVSVPIQQMSLEVIVPHLLGNKTEIKETTAGKTNAKLLSWYKQCWHNKNMDTARYNIIHDSLAVGDAAVIFYKEKGENEFKWKLLSFLEKDEFYMIKDKFGENKEFVRFYSMEQDGEKTEYCDIINNQNYTIFKYEESKWIEESIQPHGYNFLPVAFHRRRLGAYWTAVQKNIDELEKMLSRLSEDNRAKSKSRYHLGTKNPDLVRVEEMGLSDMVITEEDGKFNLINGADISGQFKFEYDTAMETIYNKLGIVFVKSKSSGDMPVGSMKLLFYPTERICRHLIEEYNQLLDDINAIFKKALMMEFPEKLTELKSFNVSASIKPFTPQDDNSINTTINQSVANGTLSKQTGAENNTFASNDEYDRLESELLAENARIPVMAE